MVITDEQKEQAVISGLVRAGYTVGGRQEELPENNEKKEGDNNGTK